MPAFIPFYTNKDGTQLGNGSPVLLLGFSLDPLVAHSYNQIISFLYYAMFMDATGWQ
jgi:hypothetical protein